MDTTILTLKVNGPACLERVRVRVRVTLHDKPIRYTSESKNKISCRI